MHMTVGFRTPIFSHDYVFKMGDGRTSHHVKIKSEDYDGELRLILNGMNDRQRQLVYELFGPCSHDETVNPELADQEEAETV